MDPLTRWNQLRWEELNEMERQRRASGEVGGRSPVRRPEAFRQPRRLAEWVTLVDMSENETGYQMTIELPQVKKEDVQISLEDGTLTITGQRKFEKNRRREQWVEPADGSFVHRFQLPNDTAPANGTAEFKDGVLTVHVAKNTGARRRQGKVGAASNYTTPERESCPSAWGINE
jgi:HSP20 family protein